MNVNRSKDSSHSADGGLEQNMSPRSAAVCGIARVILCVVMGLGPLTLRAEPIKSQSLRVSTHGASQNLNPGDFVFTDSEATVLKFDVVTRQIAVVATGGRLVRPCGIAIGPENTIYVADTGCLAVIAIDPNTGESTVLSQGDKLGVPYGIAVSADGEIFVANGQAVVGINPLDGTQRTVASGGALAVPLGIAVAPDGDLFVADASGSIVRIDLRHQSQAVVATGQYLVTPVGIAVRDQKRFTCRTRPRAAL
jgi:streptogramin lyase